MPWGNLPFYTALFVAYAIAAWLLLFGFRWLPIPWSMRTGTIGRTGLIVASIAWACFLVLFQGSNFASGGSGLGAVVGFAFCAASGAVIGGIGLLVAGLLFRERAESIRRGDR